MANQTIWDDPYYRWQQQLLNGANIANTGWQTALGLMIGSALGNRLGQIYGDQVQERNFLADMTDKIIGNGYSNVTYDKNARRFSGVDANGNTVYFGRNGQIIPQQSNQPVQAAQNLFGNEFDLGWKPQQNPYQFPTANETFANATRYNPNWRQNLFSNVVNNSPQTTPNQYQFPSQNILSGVGYKPQYQSPLLSTNYLQQNLTPQPNYNFNNWALWRR